MKQEVGKIVRAIRGIIPGHRKKKWLVKFLGEEYLVEGDTLSDARVKAMRLRYENKYRGLSPEEIRLRWESRDREIRRLLEDVKKYSQTRRLLPKEE